MKPVRPTEESLRPIGLRPTVVAHQPNRELRWLGRLVVPGIFDGEHSHEVESRPGGRTRYVQRERFTGILVGVVGGIIRDTEKGFREMSEALKARAEGRG